MKVLVTGGKGFIGLHLVEKLVNQNMQVAVIDNLATSKKGMLPKNVKLYKENIVNKCIEDIFKIENPDYVIHFAAQVSVQRSLEKPYQDCMANVAGTINLLENCIKSNVKRIIFASSAAVYGEPSYLPIDELHPKQSLSFYSLSKNTAEEYIKMFHKQFGLKYSILRFSNVFGPGQNAEGEAGVISIFIDRLLKGIPPVVFGGEQTRDFVYVKDVVRAIMAALQISENGIYNISTNTETSVKELLTILADILNVRGTAEYKPPRAGDIVRSKLDNRKAADILGWIPKYSLKEGLQKTIETAKQ
jgi:UDP-glucose 4-epimerase